MKNFIVQEFVPPDVYASLGDDAIQLMDEELLDTIQAIRDDYGLPVIVNNWHRGGFYMYRGFRPAHCTIGAANSMHKQGGAIDFSIKGISPEAIRERLIEKKYPAIKRIEAGTRTWVHIDMKDTGKDNIVLFNP